MTSSDPGIQSGSKAGDASSAKVSHTQGTLLTQITDTQPCLAVLYTYIVLSLAFSVWVFILMRN